MSTHEVENVPPPLPDVNRFTTDALLMTAGFEPGEAQQLDQLGAQAGTAQAADWGRLANSYPPELRTHDRFGRRIDEVEFHPAWHELLRVAVGHGLHATPWTRGRHVCAGHRVLPVVASRGRSRLPDLDDLLGATRPPACA